VRVDARWDGLPELLQAADTCCYAAKNAGRNRVHLWLETNDMTLARNGEAQWVARIVSALDENQFVLFAQRIVPLQQVESGLHCEVLIRLPNANGSMVLPSVFIPAAERFHLASRIDRWVLQKVIDLLGATSTAIDNVDMIAINLSGQSVGDKAFHREALQMIERALFDVSKLCFEITETAAISNMVDAMVFIEEVRAHGVRVALDDFGAGASSFGYLRTLPVDFLKIDGQFVTRMLEDPLDYSAVRCFAEVAKVVGVKTIAEFVEKEEVRTALIDLEVNYAQGYLTHRPQPLSTLLDEIGNT
jgi:EAL domain-containing protein (putative c-di-GMP-specific phosphodiesterase class I)